jgi:hypothetical protein
MTILEERHTMMSEDQLQRIEMLHTTANEVDLVAEVRALRTDRDRLQGLVALAHGTADVEAIACARWQTRAEQAEAERDQLRGALVWSLKYLDAFIFVNEEGDARPRHRGPTGELVGYVAEYRKACAALAISGGQQ